MKAKCQLRKEMKAKCRMRKMVEALEALCSFGLARGPLEGAARRLEVQTSCKGHRAGGNISRKLWSVYCCGIRGGDPIGKVHRD